MSKVIQKQLRRDMCKKKCTARASQILTNFKALVRLDLAHTDPGRRVESSNVSPTPELFQGFPGNIFASEIGHDTVTLAHLNDAASLQQVFTSQQLGGALKGLRCGKAPMDMVWWRKCKNITTFVDEYLQLNDCKWVFRDIVDAYVVHNVTENWRYFTTKQSETCCCSKKLNAK